MTSSGVPVAHWNSLLGCALAVLAIGVPLSRASQLSQRRLITVQDCVRTRRIVRREVQISADGRKLAYVVKSPNLRTNRNDYLLYVRSLLQRKQRENGQGILEGDSISGIRWLDKERIVARIRQGEGAKGSDRLVIVDTQAGTRESIKCPRGTESYSMTPDGRTIVFSRAVSGGAGVRVQKPNAQEELRGYRISFQRSHETFIAPTGSEIEVYRRTAKGSFEIRKLSFTGPEGNGRRATLPDIEAPNLSPDGKFLLFRYWTDFLPKNWEAQPVIKQFRAMHSPGALYVLALCEVDSGRIHYAFNLSGAFILETVWAADSQSYAVVSPSPFGTSEGDAEERAAAASGNEYYYLYRYSHIFTVDVHTRQVTRVVGRDSGKPGDPEFRYDGPLGWQRSHGSMVVRVDSDDFARMSFKEGEWREEQRFTFSESGMFGSSFASDGEKIVGVSESPSVPPDIQLLGIRSKRRILVTNLNPQYDDIALGRIERIEWTNRFGSRCAGDLIKPVGYESGRRYPFVFMGTSTDHEFIADTAYTTAFAPQSLASAGFVVLLAKYPIDNQVPEGQYAGGISEAYNWMAMVESAIDLLSGRGLIDADRVGIVGFSRTSWLTDFTLTHSAYRFRAASSADGEAYAYAAYTRFLDMGPLLAYEAEMGGPPYGETLTNWLAYAAPFNASQMRAPLLMEYTQIDAAYELFTLLNRQGKPVELYFYPRGEHPLDTPLERVSSLERNVDWFRFWLQDYERPSPEDPGQYIRWRGLREMQQARQ